MTLQSLQLKMLGHLLDVFIQTDTKLLKYIVAISSGDCCFLRAHTIVRFKMLAYY